MPRFALRGSRRAALPRDPVTPQDIAATIYTRLGLDPGSLIYDPLGRPHFLSTGTAIGALVV